MTQPYILNQEFTFSEFLSISLFQAFRMKIIKGLFIFLTIIGFLNAMLNSFLTPLKNVKWYTVIWQFLLPPFFLFILLLSFGALITFLLMKSKPKLFSNITLTFTDWGMEKKGESINYSASWSKFSNYKETKKFLFLFISDKESHVIQKRMFKDNNELESFKQFLSEHVNLK